MNNQEVNNNSHSYHSSKTHHFTKYFIYTNAHTHSHTHKTVIPKTDVGNTNYIFLFILQQICCLFKRWPHTHIHTHTLLLKCNNQCRLHTNFHYPYWQSCNTSYNSWYSEIVGTWVLLVHSDNTSYIQKEEVFLLYWHTSTTNRLPYCSGLVELVGKRRSWHKHFR